MPRMMTRIINGRTYWAGETLRPTKKSAKEWQKELKQMNYYAVIIKEKGGYRVWSAERFKLKGGKRRK